MAIERTFGIVKPDAVEKSAVGGVIEMIEKAGLKIVGLRAAHAHHAHGHDLEATLLELGDDGADDALGDGVGLDDGEGAFDGHGETRLR